MKHYIQFDAARNTWALYRLFENKRYRITSLSEEDLETIHYEYLIYKKNKDFGKRMLDTLIGQEETTLAYTTEYFSKTEKGKQILAAALERISYLKSLIINAEGEPENGADDGNRKDVTDDERRIILEDTGREEETGGSPDGSHT